MKKLLACLTSVILALAFTAVSAIPAQAHTPTVTANCTELSVRLATYATSTSESNTLSVWVDDELETDTTFQGSFDSLYTFSNISVTHTWRVKVVAFDDASYSFDTSGSSAPCVTPAAPTFTSSTCTDAGASTGDSYTVPTTADVTYQTKFGAADAYADSATGTFPIAPGSSIFVQAVVDPGYDVDSTNSGPWSHTYEPAADCLAGLAPTRSGLPTATAQGCDELGLPVNGFITIPTTNHVTYFIGAAASPVGDHTRIPGNYLVTAQPDVGYFLTSYPLGGWTLAIAVEAQCGGLDTLPLVDTDVSAGVDLDSLALGSDLESLAFTGTNEANGVIAIAALLLVFSGALLTAGQRIRVRRL